jgi:hypothetical protein
MNNNTSTKVVFVGDLCVSSDKFSFVKNGNQIVLWNELRKVFSDNALLVANLENPITNKKAGRPYKWANLKMSPKLHTILDGLSLAVIGNNHITDFGPQAVRETQELLESKNISYVGYGESLNDALKPVFLNVGDKKLGVVSLCCPTTNGENLATHLTPGVAPLGMVTLKKAVENARGLCDALAVYLHWGCEFVNDPAPDQLRLARYAIDCGADAVIGCHSHTIQSYENYKGRWIFYGLGNFLFKADHAQAIRENGEIEHIPLRLTPPNRESLAVSFRVVPERDGGPLMLDSIQPMHFGDDLVPKAIEITDLSFDIVTANARLRAYVTKNDAALNDRSEPVFRTQLRNGILAHWYSVETIAPRPKPSFRRLIGKIGRGLKRILKSMATDDIAMAGPRN